MIVCSFSGALGSLPAKDRTNVAAILDVLRHNPRFSVFDATEHKALARTLDRMHKRGLIEYRRDRVGYPWIEAVVKEPPK